MAVGRPSFVCMVILLVVGHSEAMGETHSWLIA